MPASVNPERPTSLKRLQNLENDFPEFDAQLFELRNILDLEEDIAKSVTREHSRAKWAAQWLLKKLQASTPAGIHARGTAAAWDLLRSVCACLPLSVAAQNLNVYSVISMIELALADSFHNPDFIISANEQQHRADVEIYGDEDADADDQAGKGKSAKRKRKHIEVQHSAKRLKVNLNSADPTLLQNQQALYSAIFGFISSLYDRTFDESISWELTNKDQMQATLRPTTSEAASIVGYSFRALAAFVAGDPVSIGADKVNKEVELCLWLWQNRKPETTKKTTEHLSKLALMSSLRLLQTLRGSDPSSGQVFRPANRAIEQLLAKFIIMPTRAEYRSSNSNSSTQLRSMNEVDEMLLDSVLSCMTSSHVAVFLEKTQLLPLFYRIAIACSPLSSPRKRASEMPWLQHLFSELARICGYDYNTDKKKVDGLVNREAFCDILQLCKEHSLIFTRQILRDMLKWLVTKDNTSQKSVDWETITAVISISPEALVPDHLGSEVELDQDDDTLSFLLYEATCHGWTASMTSNQDRNTLTERPYAIIRDGFALPLIDAFVSARAVPQLLFLWKDRLKYAFEQGPKYIKDDGRLGATRLHGNTGISVSVWEDVALLKAISDQIEMNLTSDQVEEVLDELWIVSGPDTQHESKTVALCALLGGVNSTDVVRRLLSKLRLLVVECAKRLKMYSSRSNGWTWRLLSISYSMIASIVESSDIQDPLYIDGNAPLESLQLQDIPTTVVDLLRRTREDTCKAKIYQSIEALACLATMVQVNCARHFPVEEALRHSNILSDLRDWLEGNIQTDLSTEGDWVEDFLVPLIIQHPAVWSLTDAIEDQNSFASALVTRVQCSRPVTNERGIPYYPLVRPFVQHMEHFVKYCISVTKHTTSQKSNLDVIRTKVISILIENFTDTSQTQQNEDCIAVTHEILCQIPTDWLSAESRGQILERISKDLLGATSQDHVRRDANIRRDLSLMLYFLSDEESAVRYFSDPGSIWALANQLDTAFRKDSFERNVAWPGHWSLFDCILSRMPKTLEVIEALQQRHQAERVQMNMSGVANALESSEMSAPILDRPAHLAVIRHFVSHLRLAKDSASEKVSSHESICLKIFDSVAHALKHSEGTHVAAGLATLLECLHGIPRSQRSSLSDTIDHALRQSDTLASRMYAYMLRVDAKSEEGEQWFDTDGLLNALNYSEPSEDELQSSQASFIKLNTFIGDRFKAEPEEKQAALLSNILIALKEPSRSLGALRLLHTLVSSHTDFAQSYDISPLIVGLSLHWTAESSMHHFRYTSNILLKSLSLKGARPDQYAIESLLLTLSHILSPAGPELPTTHAGHIYTSLLKVIQSILAHPSHRAHLRGRFHLLIPILQSLSRALFIPNQRHPQSSNVPSPPWLSRHDHTGLNAHHVRVLAVILGKLTDPSPSSLTTHSRLSRDDKAALTDATIAARTHMAHFGPILIADLVQCMLRGRFCAEGVRDALMPGIWGLLDVVISKGERDGVGTAVLGMGLPPAARDVVKSLVAEWRRIGGGSRGSRRK